MDLSSTQVQSLIGKHGSPLLVITKNELIENYDTLRKLLPQVNLFYAVKSNPHPVVLKTLTDIGSGFDVASEAELDQVLDLGVAPEKIIYTNPIKPFGAVKYVCAKKVDTFFFDNEVELKKISVESPGAKVILRLNVINPNCVVDLGRKFGCPPDSAESLLIGAHRSGLVPVGLSFHVGSQTSIPQPYVDTVTACRNIFNRMALLGHRLYVLDIGGGFPISYKTAMLPIESFCKPIRAALEMYFPNTTILAEPGRFISGTAATLITRIIGKENRNGIVWYYIEDGIYGTFSGCVFDHAKYQFTCLKEGSLQPCVLAGPTCDSFDIISRDEYLPPLEVGDVIIAHNVGAYTNASATTFNGVPLTKVVEIE